MKKLIPLVTLWLFSSFSLFSQDIRTIDGSNNNVDNPTWGATHTPLGHMVSNGYSDQVSEPAGLNRPNPRELSNVLFSQEGLLNDALHLSDYCWVFGQFLDHDITLTHNSNEPAFIPVPQGDQWFDPFNTGQVMIPMMRSEFMEDTGTGPDNPREHPNDITAFIDASAVYGSDIERANWLRSFEDGKLKVSSGNLLPFNTIDGEFESEIDPYAPELANDVGLTTPLFEAGDVRCNENPLLTAFHTLFVREHNRLCDELIIEYPDWTDEQLYQHARKIVGGLLQHITFEEWLPVMGVHLAPYTGYQPDVDPSITNVFSAAAFRMGHTLLNSTIQRMDNDGHTLADGNMLLQEAFFNPNSIIESDGIDCFLKGMATQVQQDMDAKVIDDVRNFLFGPPGAGGLDLAAININRGRERGLPGYNTIRADLGLSTYQFFAQINPNPHVFTLMHNIYVNPGNVDPWVGMLAERHMPGALFGETVMEIMKRQFTALRDGDRFYFENDDALSMLEKQTIRDTRFSDIIMRNTDIALMQNNVFVAMGHEQICAAADVNGQITNEAGIAIHDVVVSLENIDNGNTELVTGVTGGYFFPEVPKCQGYIIQPSKDINPLNGVTTLDMIKILKHILGSEILDSPYKIIAADANNSNAITTSDMVAIRKVILNIDDNFADNKSWRFVDAAYQFPDPSNPFMDNFDEFIELDRYDIPTNMNFIGIKIGDVNTSAIPNNLAESADSRHQETFTLKVAETQPIQAGEVMTVPFVAEDFQDMAGYQFTLNYDQTALEVLDVQSTTLESLTATNFNIMAEAGAITTSWNQDFADEATNISSQEALFEVTFKANITASLPQLLSINSRYTKAEAYQMTDNELTMMNVALAFETPIEEAIVLQQNQPNPFQETTTIGFSLAKAGPANLRVMDVTGKILMNIQKDWEKGYNQIVLTKEDLNHVQGVLYYELEAEETVITKRMVRL